MLRTQLVLTLAVVLAALLAYDLLRHGAERGSPSQGEVSVPARSREPHAGPPAPPGRLGGGAGALAARLAAVERRLEALERRRGEASPSAADTGAAGASTGRPSVAPAGPAALRAADPADPAVQDWFRALRDVVEARDAEVRRRQRASDLIAATGVALDAAQKEAVIDVTLEFRERVDETIREAGRLERSPDERREMLARVREAYGRSLARVVPAATAARLLERLGPIPGYASPKRDR